MQQDLSTQRAQARRIEELLQTVATFSDPQVRATTEELVHVLLDMYGQGLTRVLQHIAQTPGGLNLIETLADDELVESLLLLHGLHPRSLAERVTKVIGEIQPYLTRHGAQATLLRIEEGVAYLLLASQSRGCSSTLSLMSTKIVETLHEAIPDLEDVRIEEPRPSAQPQPIRFVPPRRSRPQASAAANTGEE